MDDVQENDKTIQKAVDDLYTFRDRYFENHSIDDAPQKIVDVQRKLNETLSLLDSIQDSVGSKPVYLLQRGRALNVLPEYNKEAEECLSKAVKLNPKLAEAWIYLGECYWKNDQIESAQNCFVGSLNHKKHKLALRNLSMVMRQLGKTADEKKENITESIRLAKDAVELDIHDGMSWFTLGNAYMTSFFAFGQSSAVLMQCLSAYQHAEKDPVAACNSDLHYNRAIMKQFLALYNESLSGFIRAEALDPTFSLAREKKESLVQYLSQVSQLVQAKGKLRGKKLDNLVHKISVETDLGPYSGGSYTNAAGSSVKLEPVLLSQLQSGLNIERVVVGRVVCSVSIESGVAFTFCIVDSTSACCSVTVYNIKQGWGVKIGDSVTIPEPLLQHVDIEYQDNKMKFDNIRVDNPVVLVVNGRKLTSACAAALELKLSTFT